MVRPRKKPRLEETLEDGEDEPVNGGRFSAARNVLCLHCTVCKNNYESRREWLRHLAEPYHQNPAREECFRTWGEDEEVKECVAVLFCSFPLTNPGSMMQVLERFSNNGVDLVTDFVWWPERPRVAFIQFESRKKVMAIFKSLEGSSGYVQDKLVQLKKAVDILQLEWRELLPPVTPDNARLGPAITKPVRDIPPPPPPQLQDPSHSVISPPDYPSVLPFPPPSSRIPEPRTRLQHQFNWICKSVEISQDDLEQTLGIMQVATEIIRKEHPSAQVLLVRNYHLGLRNTGTNVPLLFAYIAESSSFPDSFESLRRERHTGICAELERHLPGFQMISLDKCKLVGGSSFQHKSSGFRFNFTTNPLVIGEAQLCRLVQYLCSFDHRARPLLILVYYWARAHNVRIAEVVTPIRTRHTNLPEPTALEWLVMLFLIKEGLVPSVREILARPHKPIIINNHGTDVGFSCDPEFAREWGKSRSPLKNSQEFLKSVASLAQKFFHFYSSNLEDGDSSWLLNPKDGEIIRREEWSSGCFRNSLLTQAETNFLEIFQDVAKGSESTKHLVMADFRIYMLHPLHAKCKLSFCVKTWTEVTCAKMASTARMLGEYVATLEGDEDGGGEATLARVLESGSEPQLSSNAVLSFPPASVPFPPSSSVPKPMSPLHVQFNAICKAIEIPDEEFNHALEIAEVIKGLFRRDHPSGQVLLLRNYYLRLRNTGSNNVLLLYMYIADNLDDPFGYVPIGRAIQESIFGSPEFQRLLPGFKKRSFDKCGIGGTPFQHESSGFRFNVMTDPLTIAEAYLCLLLQYLCTFDPRARPLLSLVYFWAKSHSVRFAEESIPRGALHSNLPEPVALEWLVMLFLIREGILPSVREILERPHKPLRVCEIRQDIGFSADPEFAANWKSPAAINGDNFLQSVVKLAHKFFHVYASNLETGSWLLNPKDGEIVKREGSHVHKSKLTPEETGALTVVQESDATRGHLIISNFRIYMLHPLYVTRKLSFCVDTWTGSTCAKMKSTAEGLEKYIKFLQKRVVKIGREELTLESVLAGGHGQAERVLLELQCEMNQNLSTEIRTGAAQADGGGGGDAFVRVGAK